MNEAAKNKLWEKYMLKRTPEIREQLIIEYANVVKLVAGRLSMYLGYTVEYDDLVGYGIFGLIDAIDKFEPTKGVKFETYASLRIRGSILDQIRKMDWIPRTLRQKQKRMDEAVKKIESECGRPAKDSEVADELAISGDEYDSWKSQVQLTNMISLDDYLEQGSEVRMDQGQNGSFLTPEQELDKSELKAMLVEAIKTLTEKEQQVITFYYYEELTLKEISKILEVSESRISQLHSKALQKIKNKLGDDVDLLKVF